MSVQKSTFISDTLSFLKSDFLSSITDPISGSRKSSSKFVMTSYPQRDTEYPLITIVCLNTPAVRTGMQTTAQNIIIRLEIRIWARNIKEKDTLSQQILTELDSIQFTTSGSVNSNLHDLNILSNTSIDEIGDQNPKSRIIQLEYSFFNN